jgi:hypothetical protein
LSLDLYSRPPLDYVKKPPQGLSTCSPFITAHEQLKCLLEFVIGLLKLCVVGFKSLVLLEKAFEALLKITSSFFFTLSESSLCCSVLLSPPLVLVRYDSIMMRKLLLTLDVRILSPCVIVESMLSRLPEFQAPSSKTSSGLIGMPDGDSCILSSQD